METARHRRSKSATAVEGHLQIQRQKTVPKLPSYSSAITKENVLQNSYKQGSGTPIKKLLAEEMAKENESRRRQPSVIARLMGLDGLPSPQQGHKQQRRLLEKHQQQNASIDTPQSEQPYEGRSCRMMNSVDQQDFKDVYEDLEASHVMNHRCSSRWTANSRLLKPEIAHIQQRFMSRKCISSDGELTGTLEILDSSKELLLKYLEQPDSLFLKHYHNLQDDPSSSPYDYMSSLEPSNSAEHQGNSKVRKSTRDGSYRRDINSHKKREDGLLLQSHNYQGSRNCCHASKSHTNDKDDISTLTTRIVVLKPNIGKRVNATCVSSPESSHASLPALRKRLQCTGSGSEDILSCGKKNSSREVSFSKPISRGGRNISNEIKRKVTEHLKPSSAGLRGYAGDESSYDAYESDSSSASEMMSSRNSFDGSNWGRRSSSCPFESLVSKEAKKRLSERWKMTYKCQSMEPIAKASTLGEMLAIPERDSVHLHLDTATALVEAGERFTGISDGSGRDGPQGISSRDGWNDRCIRNLSQERSLPPSIGSRNRKTNGRRGTLVNDRVKKEKNKGKIKSRKGNLKKEGDYSEKDDGFSNIKSQPGLGKSRNNGSSPQDGSSSPIQTDINSHNGVQQEHNVVHNQAPHITDSCSCSADVPANAEPGTLTLSSDSSTDMCFKHDDSSARNQDVTLEDAALVKLEAESASLECRGPELESYESSKEADHCSPVSVLEVSFAEDVSCSPDCFETVNAEINDLRMKLQLLKMESGGYADTPMQQQPGKVFEENQIAGGDSWESSYIVDVLLYSGLEDLNPDTLDLSLWHSAECPIGPWVFNSLEKKYSDEKNELKFERRLLFDRMNSALEEMFQQYVKPVILLGVPKWEKHGVKDYLHKLLVHQENKPIRDRPENVLDGEMYWLGFRDSIDTIGEDIEELLIDDLIGEVVAV